MPELLISAIVTGIIDWSSVGRGLPAWDFIRLADFATSRNDRFLNEIVRWCGGDDTVFIQMKEMTILEMMNWCRCRLLTVDSIRLHLSTGVA